MDNWFDLFITAAVYLTIAALGVLILGALYLSTDRLRRPWLPLQRVRRVPWEGIDVFVVFMMMMSVPPLVHGTLERGGFFDWLYSDDAGTSSLDRRYLWSVCLGWILVLALVVVALRQLRAARLSDMGLTATRAARYVALAYVVWLVVNPIALAVLQLIEFVTPPDLVDQHPVTRAALEALIPSEWVLMLLMTIILAPIGEELVFRGIMLPWQLRAGWEGQAAVAVGALLIAIQTGLRGKGTQDDGTWYNPMPVLFVLALLPLVFGLPYLRLRGAKPAYHEDSTESGALHAIAHDRTHPALAIFTNGLLFAALHSGVWPTPVPLLVLGVALAWLTYRTSNLIGAIALHSLFNAVAAFSLLAEHFWK